jgi:hypothetical protein
MDIRVGFATFGVSNWMAACTALELKNLGEWNRSKAVCESRSPSLTTDEHH